MDADRVGAIAVMANDYSEKKEVESISPIPMHAWSSQTFKMWLHLWLLPVFRSAESCCHSVAVTVTIEPTVCVID